MGNTLNMDPCRFFLDLLQRPPSLNKHFEQIITHQTWAWNFATQPPSKAHQQLMNALLARVPLSHRVSGLLELGLFGLGKLGDCKDPQGSAILMYIIYWFHTYHRFIYVELRWIFSAHQGYHKVMTEAARICCLPFIVEPPIRNPPQNVRITCL